LGLGQVGRVGGSLHAGDEVVPSGDSEAVRVQGLGVLIAARQDRDLGHAAEMSGEEAADHAGADYADALDSVLLSASIPRAASSRGSSRQSEPSSSASEKIS